MYFIFSAISRLKLLLWRICCLLYTSLGDFAKELPAQFVECGIAEQDAVGISAGLSHSGKKVFVCGPACFYVARSLELVKVDLAYRQNNVKILGVSGGVAYGALGATQHSLHDIAVLRTFTCSKLRAT